MSEKLIPANKHPEILVSEAAVKKGWYALRLTERQFLTRDNTQFNDNTFIDYYSPRDFQAFKKYVAKAYISVEIVHDPTLPVAEPTESQQEPTVNKGGRPKKITNQ